MRPYQALCLDLDDTLLDGSQYGLSVERTCRQIASVRPDMDADRLLSANRDVWRAYWPEIEDHWNRGGLQGAAISLEAWRRTLHTCGCDDETLAGQALNWHQEYGRETYRLFEDVQELFATLKKARIPLALITNGASDAQRAKLRALDIEHLFDVVIVSAEVGIAKPDAAIFALAMQHLGVQPDCVWHVGDNLSTDVAGARAAGIGSVWLNRHGRPLPEGEIAPDLEIRSLADLLGAHGA
jgi:putative hydrolase of the HAD superfamily